jgi:hypothetical protein
MDVYLKKVYPLLPNTKFDWTKLNFFYSCAPKKIVLSYFGQIKPGNPSLALLREPWTPVWFPDEAFAINEYDPNAWWMYYDRHGFPSNTNIEVIHTKDDNPYYSVYGYWCYVVKGSGVYVNTGRTLRAYNKIDALLKLNVNIDILVEIAKKAQYMINTFTEAKNMIDIAYKYFPHLYVVDLKIAEMLLEASRLKPEKCGFSIHDKYNIGRINNSAVWDLLIATVAHHQGYDSVQFSVQANGNGGWAFEIVWTGMLHPLKKKEADWDGWKYINDLSTVRNPLDLTVSQSCNFDPNKRDYSIVTCPIQDLSDCDIHPLPPPYASFSIKENVSISSTKVNWLKIVILVILIALIIKIIL